MSRFRIIIEYDGTPYCGWQMQDNGPSVQAALTDAVEKLTGERVQVFGAGRTDAGVHALGQVAHFDLANPWQPHKIRDGLNFHLKPAHVAVLSAEQVDENFHARFSATKRHYLYRFITRRAPLTVERQRAWRRPRGLDVDAMNQAAQALVGQHDFTTFRSVHCQAKSPVKTVDEVAVQRHRETIEFTVSARSFLHNQVRSFAGSLERVGVGKWSVDEFRAALDAADRAACGQVAPPDGLYLVKVDYPLA
jgi:tRNA pseudouridine38-40 synthase